MPHTMLSRALPRTPPVPADGGMRQMMLVCSPTVELATLGQRTSQHGLQACTVWWCDAATGGAREGSVEG